LLVASAAEGMGNIEELIRDLAASIGMSALREKFLPVDRVVRRAVRAVNFLTAYVAGVISSAMCSTLGVVVCLPIPEEFPWGDSVRAIQSTIILELRRGEETDRETRVLIELDDVEARGRHVLELINEVVASGGGEEVVGRLREAAAELEKATKEMLNGLYRLQDGVRELFLTVTRIRKEMVDELRASLWRGPMPKKPPKPNKSHSGMVFWFSKNKK